MTFSRQRLEQESICRQVDMVMKNRLRRFKFLLKKDRIDDAMAVADEFYEWMDPEQLHNEETVFINEYELAQHFAQFSDGEADS